MVNALNQIALVIPEAAKRLSWSLCFDLRIGPLGLTWVTLKAVGSQFHPPPPAGEVARKAGRRGHCRVLCRVRSARYLGSGPGPSSDESLHLFLWSSRKRECVIRDPESRRPLHNCFGSRIRARALSGMTSCLDCKLPYPPNSAHARESGSPSLGDVAWRRSGDGSRLFAPAAHRPGRAEIPAWVHSPERILSYARLLFLAFGSGRLRLRCARVGFRNKERTAALSATHVRPEGPIRGQIKDSLSAPLSPGA